MGGSSSKKACNHLELRMVEVTGPTHTCAFEAKGEYFHIDCPVCPISVYRKRVEGMNWLGSTTYTWKKWVPKHDSERVQVWG